MFSMPLVDQYFTVDADDKYIYLPLVYNGGGEGNGEAKSQYTNDIQYTSPNYFFTTGTPEVRSCRVVAYFNFDIFVSSNNPEIIPMPMYFLNTAAGVDMGRGILMTDNALNRHQSVACFQSFYSQNEGMTMALKLRLKNSKAGDVVRVKLSNPGNISVTTEG